MTAHDDINIGRRLACLAALCSPTKRAHASQLVSVLHLIYLPHFRSHRHRHRIAKVSPEAHRNLQPSDAVRPIRRSLRSVYSVPIPYQIKNAPNSVSPLKHASPTVVATRSRDERSSQPIPRAPWTCIQRVHAAAQLCDVCGQPVWVMGWSAEHGELDQLDCRVYV